MSIICRPFLTVDEVADLLRVRREWVLQAIHQGTLGCFRIAGKHRITPEQLTDWLSLMERTPKYGVRGLSVLGREGIWKLTEEGWQWRPNPETERREAGDR